MLELPGLGEGKEEEGAVHTPQMSNVFARVRVVAGGPRRLWDDDWLAWGLLKFAVELVMISIYHDLAFPLATGFSSSLFSSWQQVGGNLCFMVCAEM